MSGAKEDQPSDSEEGEQGAWTSQGEGEGEASGATGNSTPNTSAHVLTQLQLMQNLEVQGVERMYAVTPLSWCPHLEMVRPLPARGLNAFAPCEECDDTVENWVCLVCYKVFCSRFVNEHMLIHSATEGHIMVLSFSDLSVWCYACDNYVNSQIVQPTIKEAHRSKFGENIPEN